MRWPLLVFLTLFMPGAMGARTPHPRPRRPRVPTDPLAVARRVARYRGDGDPRLAGSPEAPAAAVTAESGRTGTGDPEAIPSAAPPPHSPVAAPPGGAVGGAAPPALPANRASASPSPAAPPPPPEPTRGPVAPAAPPPIGPPAPLMLSAARLIVPAGESRVVTIMGAARLPEVATTPEGVVASTLSPGPVAGTWSLRLAGLAAGTAVLQVSDGAQAQTLSARVMPYAGQVGVASVEITGQPAPEEFVLQAARAALDTAVKREPGAEAAIGAPDRLPPELPAGQAATVSFPVSITGPDLLPVKAVARVTVRNRDLDPRDVGVLLYSNDPEQVTEPGALFTAGLDADRPARLLYHHQNVGDRPLRLCLELVNPTDRPLDAQVIAGAAGPTWDAVEAGHCAALRYVRSALQDLGTIVRVPARAVQVIARQRLPPRTTVSGLFGLRGLDAGLYVRVAAEDETAPDVAPAAAEPPGPLSEQIYLSPRRPLSARYVVGKNWAFLNLGDDPLVARGSRHKLRGNYGVSYEITLDLANPTALPQSVVLMLSPDAGEARGVFVIDGAVVEAPEVSPPVEATLATFHLQPGERRVVRVQTLPVGGSSYPARLVLRPADPLRTAQTVAGPK